MFEYVSVKRQLKVYEESSAFYIVNLVTGEEKCMGDGVDVFENVMSGSKKFYRLLKDMIDNDNELFQAYFSVDNANQVYTTWELWTYDVWGNAEDGYEVNDRFCFNRNCELILDVEINNLGTDRQFASASPSDNQIKELFGIDGDIDTSGDDVIIYINGDDDYPIGEMNCISHSSLSPIH